MKCKLCGEKRKKYYKLANPTEEYFRGGPKFSYYCKRCHDVIKSQDIMIDFLQEVSNYMKEVA